MIRRAAKYFLWAGFCFLVGFTLTYQMDRFKTWLIYQVAAQSKLHSPVLILPQTVEFTGWPIGLAFHKVRLQPQGNLARSLAPLTIEQVRAGFHPFHLLTGNFGLSEVVVVGPDVTWISRAQEGKSDRSQSNPVTPEAKVSTWVKRVLRLPIREIRVEKMRMRAREEASGFSLKIEDLDFSLINQKSYAVLNLASEGLALKRTRERRTPINQVSLTLQALIRPESVTLTGFEFQQGASYVISSGTLKGSLDKLDLMDIQAQVRLHAVPAELTQAVTPFLGGTKLPKIDGPINLDLKFVSQPGATPVVSGTLQTEGTIVEGFVVGELQVPFELQKNLLKIHKARIESRAGVIEIPDGELRMDEAQNLRTRLKLSRVDLHQLLKNLTVGDLPLRLMVQGEVPCEGHLRPTPELRCEGGLQLSGFRVFNPDSNQNIVAFEQLQMQGSVFVDSKGVYPKATLQLGTSLGSAEGKVEYDKGFKFTYKSDKLDFKDLKSLADLKFEGALAIEGSTEGDSSAATMNFSAKSQNLWFEDYAIGNASLTGQYQKGMLSFRNVEGLFQTTRYRGQIAINLEKETVRAIANIPYLEAHDLQKMFSRKVELPFDAFGAGAGQIEVMGPLEFTELTYNLKSSIYRGSVAGETFQEAHFDIHAVKGEVRSDRIEVRKGRGLAVMHGEGHPTGQISAEIDGKGFSVEDSEFLNRLGLKISGLMNFQMTLSGHVLRPETLLSGNFSKILVGSDPVPDSDFRLAFTRASIAGRIRFLGDQIDLDFQIPWVERAPFRWVLKTRQWNFAPLFSLIQSGVTTRDFETNLSMNMKLESPEGGFWKSTGGVEVSMLRVRKGSMEMYTPKPLRLSMNKGVLNIENFLIQGDNTLLTAEAANSTYENLKLKLNGKVELSLLSFLTPFLSDFHGVLSLSTQITGNGQNPRLIGSAFIEKGYAKAKDIPHAFENFKADVLFNQDRILINSFEAGLATGKILADGSLDLVALKNIPVKLKGRFDNVNLNIPTGVSTKGSGDFKISGSWFPYLFSANYRVQEGLVTKNFDEEDPAAATAVRRSSFLPRLMLQEDFEVLRYDINAILLKTIRLRNNLFDSDASGNLTITGTASEPLMGGEIQLKKGGTLFFRETPFEISTASFKFQDPKENNPLVYASASARVKDYDISLLIQGTRKNLLINLKSQPNLAEQEIISLLALGITSTEMERVPQPGSSSTTKTQDGQDTSRLSNEIGTALLSKNPFGKEIKKRYGFDLKFSSAVDSTDNASIPKIVLSKQWSPKVETSASRTLGNKVIQDVKLQYQLNTNLSLIGSWEGREWTEESGTINNQDLLGVDLNYKVEFK